MHATSPAAGQEAPLPTAGRVGFFLFLGTELMLFAAFLAALLVARSAVGSAWPMSLDGQPLTKQAFGLVNTLLLLGASFLIMLAASATAGGKPRLATCLLLLALLPGFMFLGVKGTEYQEKFTHGLAPWEADKHLPHGRLWASYYFGMTGLHAAHIVAGLAFAAAMALAGICGHLSKASAVTMANLSSYWHFVDAVWLVMLGVFYFGW